MKFFGTLCALALIFYAGFYCGSRHVTRKQVEAQIKLRAGKLAEVVKP